MGYIANGNQRANPHESPQADMVAGRGSYEIPGMTYNRTNQHDLSVPPLDNVCVSCHMRTLSSPYEHANHNFSPEVVSCYGCHGTPANFDINGKQTEIVNMLDQLAQLLPNPVLGDDGHYTVSSDTRDTLTWTLPKRQAGWAWQFVHLDGSSGVHNYNYAHDLLTNAIDHLTSGAMSKPESYENATSMR
jgi:formate-dependent nitrite reductase cytochrome c552 subunit